MKKRRINMFFMAEELTGFFCHVDISEHGFEAVFDEGDGVLKGDVENFGEIVLPKINRLLTVLADYGKPVKEITIGDIVISEEDGILEVVDINLEDLADFLEEGGKRLYRGNFLNRESNMYVDYGDHIHEEEWEIAPLSLLVKV